METWQISQRELDRYEYSVLNKINGHRFDLETKINSYYKKENGERIFLSLKDFFLAQGTIYDKLKETYPENISLASALYLAAKIGKETLNYYEGTRNGLFENKKINFEKDFSSITNELIELYLKTMEEIKSPQNLESITNAFYFWNQKNSLDFLDLHQKTKEELKNKEIRIRERVYLFDFFLEEETKKPSLDIKIFERKKEEKKLQKPLYEYIAGHDNVKREFKEISLIIKNLEYFSSFIPEKKLFKNYLLVGPPGTGKTTLVNSLAEETGLYFLSVPCVELGSIYYSQTATNVNDLFRSAKELIVSKKYSGVILFFDEFDHLGRSRGTSSSSEDDKVITTLNNWLDGNNSVSRLITIGATNRIEQIDPALVNRFRILEVGYPKTEEGVIAIYQAIIRKAEDYAKKKLFGEIDYKAILPFWEKEERFKSGRVIENIIYSSLKNKGIASLQKTNKSFIVETEDILKICQEYDFEDEEKSERMGRFSVRLR